MKTNLICIALILAGLWAITKFNPGPGEADVRGPAKPVEWPSFAR
jgi:hypothetical protein